MKKTRKPDRNTKPTLPRKTERAFIATTSDALAAFLSLRGCHRVGITIERAGSRQHAAHGFEDEAPRLMFAVGAFESAEDDDIPAGHYIATVAHLRKIRRDADRRLESDAADEANRLRVLEEDVRTWERKRR